MENLKDQMHKHAREVDKLKALWGIVREREIKSLRREVQLNSLEKALKMQSISLDEKQQHLRDLEIELEMRGDHLLQEEIRIDKLRSYGKKS